jgi:hypothetical protein
VDEWERYGHILPLESSFRHRVKETVYKEVRKSLEIKSASSLSFIVTNLLKCLFQVEADFTSKQLQLES